ncbi:MAG: nuclear transport factor 2 family protein [Rhodanobacteraceae bacterium]|nr:nuclear transport factor 2 family protein [Rhodanobacteraceae bacterium]
MSAETNRALVTRFYEAFARRDGAAMAACYHPEARFSDPAFPDLRGAQIGAMWTMLCQRAQDFSLTFRDVQADAERGSAHWEAKYLFSKTGRQVHNIIDAEFAFRDGLIVSHDDRFDFWRWSRQALGPAGLLLGWSGFLRAKVQAEAAKGLAIFQKKGG